MRVTHALVQVALALLDAPDDRHWGYELSQTSGIRSGVLYPMLRRMLDDGWLADGWENPAELTGKRPPRRYYTVTEKGWLELGALRSNAQQDPRFSGLRWGWSG
jgi:PadR family transcriptional regulator PadR